MIKLRHQQPTVWEGLFAEEVAELWEPRMRVVDELLEDEELLDTVYEAQGKRHAKSRVRKRQQTPAEVSCRIASWIGAREYRPTSLDTVARTTLSPVPAFDIRRLQ